MLDDADRTARDDRGVPALRIGKLAHLIVGPSDQIGDGRIGTPHDAVGGFEGGYEIRRDDANDVSDRSSSSANPAATCPRFIGCR
jgi:hypothetical protein